MVTSRASALMPEDQLNIGTFEKLFPVTHRDNKDGSVTTTIFIYDVIGYVSEFSEVISVLDDAQDNDTVILKINSPGGHLYTMLTLIDAIHATKAQTIAECTGMVASAATMIALSCSGLYIAEHTTFMIHNFSGGTYGKGHEIIADIEHMVPNNRKIFEDAYKKFLTKKEIDKLIEGRDYYFTAEEVRKRWLKVLARREKLYIAEQKSIYDEHVLQMIAGLEEDGYTVTKK